MILVIKYFPFSLLILEHRAVVLSLLKLGVHQETQSLLWNSKSVLSSVINIDFLYLLLPPPLLSSEPTFSVLKNLKVLKTCMFDYKKEEIIPRGSIRVEIKALFEISTLASIKFLTIKEIFLGLKHSYLY